MLHRRWRRSKTYSESSDDLATRVPKLSNISYYPKAGGKVMTTSNWSRCAILSMACLVTTLVTTQDARAWDTGVALTPPMGWNSWNKFGCNVSEDLIKSMADGMVASGMKDAGYQYVVIDDCWQVGRDADGNIVPDTQRFPSGMKALGDYIHTKGLKFGIYSDAGEKTCAKRPGSLGHEYQDALMYARWASII
jgi:alpha-galactosidase